jgi:hypothetical protein
LWPRRHGVRLTGLNGGVAASDGLHFEFEWEVVRAQAGVPVPLKPGRRFFLSGHGGSEDQREQLYRLSCSEVDWSQSKEPVGCRRYKGKTEGRRFC